MIDKQLAKQLQIAFNKEPNIKLVYVLGSIVSGRIGSDSDFDLAVVLEDKDQIKFEDIYDLVAHVKFPKDLDLSVVDKTSSPLFLFQIISTGECVYQKSPQTKVSFETYVLKNYYDSAHIRKIYDSYLKDKFPYVSR